MLRPNIFSHAIDYVMRFDHEDQSEKQYFVKHFLLDFRFGLMQPKIEQLVGKYIPKQLNYEL